MGAPAKLTGALLARKGSAVPAGHAPGPARQPVHPAGSRAGGATEKHVKLSLRLDAERHHRLRLTAEHMGMSLQEVLVRALDSYLDQVGAEVIRGASLDLNRTLTTAKA